MVVNNLDIISIKHILIARGNLKTETEIEDTDYTSSLKILYKSYLHPGHIERFNMKVSYGSSTSRKKEDCFMT